MAGIGKVTSIDVQDTIQPIISPGRAGKRACVLSIPFHTSVA
jgi:hypothetical protein